MYRSRSPQSSAVKPTVLGVDTSIRVLGVDPSLTSTGIAFRRNGEVFTDTIKTGDLRGSYRLGNIYRRMLEILDTVNPTHICIEGYAMGFGRGSSPGRVFDIGELGGLLRWLFWERGISVMIAPPATMKKAITGKGRAENRDAEKTAVISALGKTYGLHVPQNDEADAVGLMLIGEMRNNLLNYPSADTRKSVELCEIRKGRLQLIAKK